MTTQFWQNQLDYIYFFYGLAFVLLASICVARYYRKDDSLSWLWLGLFGIVHGINEWLEMLALSLGDTNFFLTVRTVVITLSFVLLTEFGRAGLIRQRSAKSGILIYVPLLVISITGCLAGLAGFNAAVRYSFGFVGGLLSSIALLRTSTAGNRAGKPLLFAAVFMALYALATGVIVAAAPFFPAAIVNHDSFFAITGIPIQLVRGILLILFSASIWTYHQQTRQSVSPAIEENVRKRYGMQLAFVLLAVLAAGWFFTGLIGGRADKNARNDMVRQVEIAAAAINAERVKNIIPTASNLNAQDHIRLHHQLQDISRAGIGLRKLYLMVSSREQGLLIVEAVSGDGAGNSALKRVQLSKKLFEEIAPGKTMTTGPYQNGKGSFISVFTPVRDPATMRTIAVLGADFNADDWQTMLAEHRIVPICITLLISLLLISLHVARLKEWESTQMIAASEKQLLEAQAIAHLGSWEYDPEKDKEYRSAEFFRILGLPVQKSGLARDSVLEHIHPADRENVKARITDTLENGKPYDAEYRIVRPDGTERTVYAQGKAILDETGRTTRFVGTILDITDRKNLEAQLYQAQKMEAVGQLAGGIAHDFNNILTAIIGYSHLLLTETVDDDIRTDYLGQIMNAAERAAELTHGLLAYSRKQVMAPTSVNLSEVVSQQQKMLRRLISENIELTLESTREELTVVADRGMIEQMLMNLVTNAKDAMPDGGRLVIGTSSMTMGREFLHAHGYGKSGEYACIAVGDTGCGMAEQTRKRIFEPFFTTKEAGKGTGLGLSIAYGIVKQHNGYINVCSEPGRGTTFRIYLPRVDAKAEETKIALSEAPPRGGTETLLLAEDDAGVCNFHRTLLETAGYEVITAVDGDDALEKFVGHENRINLLILDVIMPKMNGKKVFEMIRERKPEIKALFMSGYSADILHEVSIDWEKVGYMAKPVKPGELLKKVREVLDDPDRLRSI